MLPVPLFSKIGGLVQLAGELKRLLRGQRAAGSDKCDKTFPSRAFSARASHGIISGAAFDQRCLITAQDLLGHADGGLGGDLHTHVLEVCGGEVRSPVDAMVWI